MKVLMVMNLSHAVLVGGLCVLSSAIGLAQEPYKLELFDAAPQAKELSTELVQRLSPKGYRIKNSSDRTTCEVWLCKQWEIDANFVATEQRLYPFQPGQLIGVIHVARKEAEFRNHTVASGWYTLRFELQPVDGNHEGTSITRDFLLLVAVEDDAADKQWKQKELFARPIQLCCRCNRRRKARRLLCNMMKRRIGRSFT
jgi:hypothetical protein